MLMFPLFLVPLEECKNELGYNKWDGLARAGVPALISMGLLPSRYLSDICKAQLLQEHSLAVAWQFRTHAAIITAELKG